MILAFVAALIAAFLVGHYCGWRERNADVVMISKMLTNTLDREYAKRATTNLERKACQECREHREELLVMCRSLLEQVKAARR